MTLECMGLEKSEANLELVDGQLPISVPGRQLYAACPGLRARAAMCVDGDVEEDGSNWVGDGGSWIVVAVIDLVRVERLPGMTRCSAY